MWIESRGASRAMVVQRTKKLPWVGKRGCQACRWISAAAPVVAHVVVAVIVAAGSVTPLSMLAPTNWGGL